MEKESFVFLVLLAYLADLIFGDPTWFPHPVKGIGKLIVFFEKHLRKISNGKNEKTIGVLLFFLVTGISSLIAFAALNFFTGLNRFVGAAIWVYIGYASLAVKDLGVEANKIFKELKTGSLAEARKKLARIVGRDTENLKEEKIVTAAVESIAESTNDGIVAPLFYLCLGGPVLAIAYKTVNTLDSMVGHKNEKYRNFGWFSAKMDDVVNFIPARLTGLLISLSFLLTGKGFLNPFQTMLKDGRKHSSPNSGIPEAAMAGGLGIKLGGRVSYDGEVFEKPYLGEELKKPEPEQITVAIRISFISSLLALLMFLFVRILL